MISGTLSAVVSGPAGDITLSGQDGELRGDLTGLCQALISQLACDSQSEETFTLKVDALLPEDHSFPGVERSIPVRVTAPRCTPVATQAEFAFVLPTPRPTPAPDLDQDGFSDLDGCLPDEIRVKPFSRLSAAHLALGRWRFVVFALAVFLLVYVGPRFSIRYLSPPPDVYIAVCTRDTPAVDVISVRQAGIQRRSARVKLGGDQKKADVYISGLRPVEFTVDVRGDKILLLDASKGEIKATFRQLSAEQVITSNPGIRLWVATKRSALQDVTY